MKLRCSWEVVKRSPDEEGAAIMLTNWPRRGIVDKLFDEEGVVERR